MSPKVELSVPASWRQVETADATTLLRPARNSGSLRTNAVVGTDWVPTALSIESRSQRSLDYLGRTRANLDVIGEHAIDRPDCSGTARIVCFDLPRSDARIAQLLVLLGRIDVDGDRAAHCEIVATCAFDELDRHAWAFTQIIQSIRFGDAACKNA